MPIVDPANPPIPPFIRECVCKNGFYLNTLSSTCDKCHLKCSKCTGALETECLECSLEDFRVLEGSKCVC